MDPLATPSLEPSAPRAIPALEPDAVARMARLTREYGRLSQGQAGLSALLGGLFLFLVAALEGAGHHGRFTWLGALSPLPLRTAAAVATLPFLWLGARFLLHRWATARFGLVVPIPEPADPAQRGRARLQSIIGRYVGPGLLLLGVISVWTTPLSARLFRSLLLVALAGTLPWAFPHLKGRLERIVGILLFLGAALLLCGVQMAAGDSFLAYPLVGTVALVVGLRDHLAFRRVRRDLERAG